MASEIRTRFLDYDARREPKSDRYCIRCQRDLRGAFRVVHLLPGEPFVVHPYDVAPEHIRHLIGMDCAKKLGIDWTEDPGEVRDGE